MVMLSCTGIFVVCRENLRHGISCEIISIHTKTIKTVPGIAVVNELKTKIGLASLQSMASAHTVLFVAHCMCMQKCQLNQLEMVLKS
jgi:hypothetical protein